MKLISWNVNGLRACLGKGFTDYFAQQDADFFCLQETKMQPGQAQIPAPDYVEFFNSAEKKGYSGTADSRQANAAFGQNGHGQRSA